MKSQAGTQRFNSLEEHDFTCMPDVHDQLSSKERDVSECTVSRVSVCHKWLTYGFIRAQ